jgi:dolichyl-phosphate beta-glucosyltransferase
LNAAFRLGGTPSDRSKIRNIQAGDFRDPIPDGSRAATEQHPGDMTEPAIDLSIVVPVYNAEDFIQQSIDEIAVYAASQDGSCELIVVDDGSTDTTPEILDRAAAEFPIPIQIIRLERNRGKGAAVARGMSVAGGRRRVFLDADLAFPPKAIDDVRRELDDGAPVVIANRVHLDSRYVIKPSFFRYLYTRHLAGRFFNLIVRILLLPGIRDSQAGLKGFTAEAADRVFDGWLPRGFSFDLAILARARARGFEIRQIPVEYRYDSEPTTVHFLADTGLMLRDLAVIRTRVGGPSIRSSLRELSQWAHRKGESLDRVVSQPPGRSLVVAAGVLALIGLAVFRLWSPHGALAVACWLLALTAFLVVIHGADEDIHRERTPVFFAGWERGFFVAILVGTAVLRFWHLGDAPTVIHGDSAECGLQGLAILRGRVADIFDFSPWYNTPYLAFVPYTLSFATVGLSVVGLRLPSAVLGTLSVIPLYFMVRSWRGVRAAQVAAALYALSHAAIHFGRIGLWNIQTLFLELCAFALLTAALKQSRVFPAALAGVAAGLALYSYTAGRLILVVVVAFLGLQFLQGQRRLMIRALAVFLIGAAVTAVPLTLGYVKAPWALTDDRAAAVMVLGGENRAHFEQRSGDLSAAQILWKQTRATLAGFVSRGDTSGQYATTQPLHTRATAAIAVVGLLITLAGIRRPESQFVLLWGFLGLLLSSILIIDPPFYPRLVVVFPVPMILVATAIAAPFGKLEEGPAWRRALASLLVLVVVAQAAYFSYTGYRSYLAAVDRNTKEWDVVKVFERVGSEHDYYLFGGPTITVLLPAFKLFAEGRRVVVGFTQADVPRELQHDTVFVAFASVLEEHSQLQRLGSVISERFPDTQREVVTSRGRPQLVLFFSSVIGGSRDRPGGAHGRGNSQIGARSARADSGDGRSDDGASAGGFGAK